MNEKEINLEFLLMIELEVFIDMKIDLKQIFKISGDFTGESLIEEYEFSLQNSDKFIYYLKINPNTKTIITKCKKEISNDLYRFLNSGYFRSIKIMDDKGHFRNDIDQKIFDALNNEISFLFQGFYEVTERFIHYLKIWLSHTEIESIKSYQSSCSMDGNNWIEIGFESKINAIDLVIYSNFDDQNCKLLQRLLDNNIEPFIALDFLMKSINEKEIKSKWIYATIAAELAIKEYLIAKKPYLETLLNELPSPPLDKLYGKILMEYGGITSYIKIKDLQTGIKIRNQLIHRPKSIIPLTTQNTFIYIRLIEATIYQLLFDLYPEIAPIIKDHYPPKIGYTELEKIPGF